MARLTGETNPQEQDACYDLEALYGQPRIGLFVGNNPISRVDPDGCFWSLALNSAFLVLDIYRHSTHQISDAQYGAMLTLDLTALAVDVLSLGSGPGAGLQTTRKGVSQ